MKQLPDKKGIYTLLELYAIYDGHRDSILWLIEDFDANDYYDYERKYAGSSKERFHFVTLCGFFELSGVLVKKHAIEPNRYFDLFNPAPFWHGVKKVVDGMRKKRPHIYENFELLYEKRIVWTKKRWNSSS